MPAAPDRPPAPLGDDARTLLRSAARPRAPRWLMVAFATGLGGAVAGVRAPATGGFAAELTRWRAAVDELLSAGLVTRPSPAGSVCQVTEAGLALAGTLA
jgi:hypothetical protein